MIKIQPTQELEDYIMEEMASSYLQSILQQAGTYTINDAHGNPKGEIQIGVSEGASTWYFYVDMPELFLLLEDPQQKKQILREMF